MRRWLVRSRGELRRSSTGPTGPPPWCRELHTHHRVAVVGHLAVEGVLLTVGSDDGARRQRSDFGILTGFVTDVQRVLLAVERRIAVSSIAADHDVGARQGGVQVGLVVLVLQRSRWTL